MVGVLADGGVLRARTKMTSVVYRVDGGEWKQCESWDAFTSSFERGIYLPVRQPTLTKLLPQEIPT